MEFHADLALPYRNEFQSTPMHGQFLLVQLETPNEAVLGRIAAFSSEGKLSSGNGEEFNIRAVQENREVPDDLRRQYLKYRINIRVLGVLRSNGKGLTFVPSHRRLPHVGSKVAFLSGEVLREVCGHNIPGAEMGHFALGEYVYAHGSEHIQPLEWMQIKDPEVLIRFQVENLVARRTFIFARAGFGKSNLNKLLFSRLYKETPTVEKRQGRKVPVGTIIFDPDGEYFWPDDKGRPGLCDVQHLEDKLVVFTSRKAPSEFYGSFVAGGIRLDIRQLRPADVISIALPPERQDQQNVAKLRSLPADRWSRLVDLIQRSKNLTSTEEVGDILGLTMPNQEAEAVAARSNMTNVVNMLHDPSSQLMGLLVKALEAGKICVVDISQMRGNQGFVLSGIILRRIFDRNQQEFTSADPKTIPTIAVIEEAQSVLNDKAAAAEPYISWVKEGRKYDLGALLVTQQPGSIPNEILSQGDNWFIFHLLSAGDLVSVKRANAHFSDDLLSSLLNEPIQGQGVFWSSVGGKPYPVSMRALSFERLYKMRDVDGKLPAIKTFATQLREADESIRAEAVDASVARDNSADGIGAVLDDLLGDTVEPPVDIEAAYLRRAVTAVKGNNGLMKKLEVEGAYWMAVQSEIEKSLPGTVDDARKKAFELTPQVMTEIFGKQGQGWHKFKNQNNKALLKKGAG